MSSGRLPITGTLVICVLLVASPGRAYGQAGPTPAVTAGELRAEFVRLGFNAETPTTWWTGDRVTTFRVSDPPVPDYGRATVVANGALVQSPMAPPSVDAPGGGSDADETLVDPRYATIVERIAVAGIDGGCRRLVQTFLVAGLPSGATAEFVLETWSLAASPTMQTTEMSGSLVLDYPAYPVVAGRLVGVTGGTAVQLTLQDGSLALEVNSVAVPLRCVDASLAFGASSDMGVVLRLSEPRAP